MRTYHGWIFKDRTITPNTSETEWFSVGYEEDNELKRQPMGAGPVQGAECVRFFETVRKLGPVKLEDTPLGIRVYTTEETKEEIDPISLLGARTQELNVEKNKVLELQKRVKSLENKLASILEVTRQ